MQCTFFAMTHRRKRITVIISKKASFRKRHPLWQQRLTWNLLCRLGFFVLGPLKTERKVKEIETIAIHGHQKQNCKKRIGYIRNLGNQTFTVVVSITRLFRFGG